MQRTLSFTAALAALVGGSLAAHAVVPPVARAKASDAPTAPKLIAPQTAASPTAAAAPTPAAAPSTPAAQIAAQPTASTPAPARTAATNRAKMRTVPKGKVLLQYKFAMGEVLRYQVRHSTNLRTTIDNTTQQVETHSESVKAWKVTDVLPSGEMEFMHVVERVKMTNREPDHPINKYDSTVDKTPPRGFEQAAGAVGVPLLIVRIAPTGEVTAREEKRPQPSHTADMPITLELPREPVSVGERWSHSYDVPANRQSNTKMIVRTRRLCKLRQVRGGVATIDVQYQILTPVDPFVRAQLIDRLTDGAVRFDIRRGRIIEQEHNVDKRVLGFRGNTSSVHLVARLQERLIENSPTKIAEAPTSNVKQTSATLPR
jgi:hypothetical protein